MESCNALCSLIFLCVIGASEGKFFALPSNWKVAINNSNLPRYSTEQGPFRAVTDGYGNAIVSESHRFGLGFIDVNSSGKFVLSVVMGLNLTSLPAMEIWTANRNRTVAEGALIKLQSQGNLVLEDSDGTVVWSIGTGKSSGILMAKNGNFQIYNTTNSSLVSAGSNLVWQSWDHPTHTLVPGQALKRGQALVSNSSATKTSAGSYKLVMEPGGLVLFYTSSRQEPYWSMGLQGLDYQGILRPCFYNSSSVSSEAVYTVQNLTVSFNGTVGKSSSSSSSCANGNQSLSMAPPNFDNENEYKFLRLDRDGSLRVYRVSPMPGQNDVKHWRSDYELDPSNKNCKLPTACGPYGICNNGQCSCPGSGTDDEFNQIQSLDVTQGCYSRQGKPMCSQPSAPRHFMSLEGVDYYPNDYRKPEANVSTVEKCRSLCNSSCSCTAAFFRSSSSSCYFADGPLSSLKLTADQTYKAYIKVLNKLPPKGTSGTSGFSNSLSIGSIAAITLSSAAAALFLCLITIIFVRRSRTTESVIDEEEIDLEEMEEEAFLKTLPGLPPRFTYHELKEATDNFSRKLGTGGFGSVYEGVLKDKTGVAVKKLDGPKQGYKEFRAEVATIGSISHMNLVRLRGFCADSRQRLLVYELMDNVSLDKWLFSRPDDNRGCLTWEQRFNVAVGTARGLAYLHEQCREPIMHLDIKPQNILLDKSFMPKVSDFGMSKLLNDDMTQVMTGVRGTPGYLAPEWLRYSIATKKCDVYSFGMVLLELVSGRKNFDPSAADPRLCYFPAWAMLRALEGRYMDLVDKRLGDDSVDREGVTRMTKVAFWCIQDNPNQRPWMSVALKMLEGEWDIPDAPMWLLQRGPQFLEGYGYEPMEDADADGDDDDDDEERDEASLVGNSVGAGGSFGSILTIPSAQLAAAR